MSDHEQQGPGAKIGEIVKLSKAAMKSRKRKPVFEKNGLVSCVFKMTEPLPMPTISDHPSYAFLEAIEAGWSVNKVLTKSPIIKFEDLTPEEQELALPVDSWVELRCWITPRLALYLFQNITRSVQRRVRRYRVKPYAITMTNQGTNEVDQWIYNGEPLHQDTEGNMFNGQHRLLACWISQVPFETKFIKGCDRKLIGPSLDGNLVRNDVDVFQTYLELEEEVKQQPAMAKAVTTIIKIQRDIISTEGRTKHKVSSGEFKNWIQRREKALIEDFIDMANAVAKYNKDRLIENGVLLGFWYAFKGIDENAADRFIMKYLRNEAVFGEPIHYIRGRMVDAKGTKNKAKMLTPDERKKLLIKAWNDFYTNDNVMSGDNYKVGGSVSWPEIAGIKVFRTKENKINDSDIKL